MSPQKENGYTPIANELLEALCRLHISGNEWSYVHAVLRKTYGYQKKEDWVTNSQIANLTGLHPVRVSEAKKKLLELQIVTENRNKISLQKDYSKWGKLRKTVTKVTENRNSELRKTVYTKETITKENKESEPKGPREVKIMNYEIVSSLEEEREKRPPRYPNAPAVFKLFSIIGNVPANWKINTAQLKACENLFKERGLEKIESALEFYSEMRDVEFCPQITTPFDLDSKWTKLGQFKLKQ